MNTVSNKGSSPLTRGKRTPVPVPCFNIRLIPAHAGKTTRVGVTLDAWRAHPRSRGENSRSRARRSLSCGSSPLTRGKLAQQGATLAELRLIPAHAGKTLTRTARCPEIEAHPRSRGENPHSPMQSCGVTGSSPLTRGKLTPQAGGAALAGLIPAHAGKTYATRRDPSRPSAHPRSRGENDQDNILTIPAQGSSPLTRGKQDPAIAQLVAAGLIPAHAGKTLVADTAQVAGTAHPRSRGENVIHDCGPFDLFGSSPLTRGKHVPIIQGHLVGRLIPAHAGKT